MTPVILAEHHIEEPPDLFRGGTERAVMLPEGIPVDPAGWLPSRAISGTPGKTVPRIRVFLEVPPQTVHLLDQAIQREILQPDESLGHGKLIPHEGFAPLEVALEDRAGSLLHGLAIPRHRLVPRRPDPGEVQRLSPGARMGDTTKGARTHRPVRSPREPLSKGTSLGPGAMGFLGRDIISIGDLSRSEIDEVLRSARRLIPVAEGSRRSDVLRGQLLALGFFEPSTRTRLSFETAMLRLGGQVITIADPLSSSVAKGETLSDTVRMLSSYADALVIRHPNEGASRLAAQVSDKPVINAGDGAGQHPTQTLLDLATMQERFETLHGLKVVLMGDLRYGRTVHSLARALALFGTELVLASPPTLRMPESVRRELDQSGIRVTEESELGRAVRDADVLYVTRIQKERFGDLAEYARVSASYRLDPSLLGQVKPKFIVMHPLPRVAEIPPEVDSSPHAAYFRQAFLAVPVRMALLSLILTGKVPVPGRG